MTGTPQGDPTPTLWDRVEHSVRGCPAPTVVNNVFAPPHWAEGQVVDPIDGVAGRVTWGGILPTAGCLRSTAIGIRRAKARTTISAAPT